MVTGLFLAFAFPLGVILPVFATNGKNTSASNQEAMIIFGVGCNVAGMLGLLASRIGVRLHVAGPKIGMSVWRALFDAMHPGGFSARVSVLLQDHICPFNIDSSSYYCCLFAGSVDLVTILC